MKPDNLIKIPDVLPHKWFDKYAAMPTLFTLIVLFQGCFGGLGVVQQPKRLVKLADNPFSRALFITAIAYTASQDIETAILCTAIFFLFLHFMRTDDEKAEAGFVF